MTCSTTCTPQKTAATKVSDLPSEPSASQDEPGQALEQHILGEARVFTAAEIAADTGVDLEKARRLWRALGFPEHGAAKAFTQSDAQALSTLVGLVDSGLIDFDLAVHLTRAVGQTMARLSDWEVSALLTRVLELAREQSGADDERLAIGLRMIEEFSEPFEALLLYVWRRHLAAAVVRMPVSPAADGRECLVVGVADVIGFTRATRRRSTAELAGMIERFGSSTTEVIAEGRGRIVKTIGDEVLFVAHTVGDGAAIALALQDRVRTEPALPPLRIGLAVGSVLVRDGDVYGEVVNTAAHLTGHARPDTVLVDREAAEALAVDARFALRPLRPVAVPDDRRLYPWVLERAT